MEENKKRPNLILDPVKFKAAIYDNAASEDAGFSNYSYWRSTIRTFFKSKVVVVLVALVVFLINGKVLLPLGIVAGLFNVAGNYLGARMFEKGGAKAVKPVMVIVLIIFFIRVITDLI